MLLTRLRLLSVFLVVLVTDPASAGTINVLGSVDFGPGPVPVGNVNLGGDRGFTLSFGGAFFSVFAARCADPGCAPGTTISLNAVAIPDFGGNATLDGRTYSCVGCFNSPPGVTNVFIEFAGQTTAPPFGDFTKAILTVPVGFSGTFTHEDTSFGGGDSEQLVAGPVIATLTLDKFDFGPQFGVAWRYDSIQYELEPVPEPATLLLWGMTAAGLGLTVRRKRRRTRDSQPSPHSVTTGSRSMGPAASPIARP
jgi:hypothetical protein